MVLVSCDKDGEVEVGGVVIDFSQSLVQKTEITVWIDDEDGEYMAAIIDAFNEDYPNIVVNHQHMGSVDAREKLKTFGPSGNGADVFQFPHDHLAAAYSEGLLYALPSDTQELINSRSHEMGIEIATINEDGTDKLYAVPMSLEAVTLYYNKALVSEAPATIEELITAGNTWNAATVASTHENSTDDRTNAEAGYYYMTTSNHWADSYFDQFIFSAFGFRPFGENGDDSSAVGFDSQAMTDALSFMVNDLKPVVSGGNDNVDGQGASFETGSIPFIITGPWSNEAYVEALGDDLGIATLPTVNGVASAPYAGAIMASVYKYAENPSDAIKFVEFLSSDIAMEIQYEYKTKLPALKADLIENIAGVNEDELLLTTAAQLENAIPMPTIEEVQYYWGPAETMIRNVWINGTDPATAASDAEESYEALKALGS
jgi:arabinogalactan oligomer/maltooligosaccharide transport system substrate-binding protein